MKKVTFDRHVVNLYEELKLTVEKRYGDNGQDALHDALTALYSRKAYASLSSKISDHKMTGWLVQSTIFSIRSQRRDESKHRKRYTLLSDLTIDTLGGKEIDIADDEYPIDVVHDVQVAIGTLSAYHQNLVYAQYYDGETLREIASRIGETFYRVFTEMEIAKACLRTQLESYRR